MTEALPSGQLPQRLQRNPPKLMSKHAVILDTPFLEAAGNVADQGILRADRLSSPSPVPKTADGILHILETNSPLHGGWKSQRLVRAPCR